MVIRSLFLLAVWGAVAAQGAAAVRGELLPDGRPPQVDFPTELRQENIQSLGLGCCVFRSLDHAGRWQDIPALMHFPEWMLKNRIPGGGWPQKVDELIDRISRDRGMETPKYIQVEENDLELLEMACKNRLCVSVTFYYSPTGNYGGRRIHHMVNLMHADGKHYATLDNNHIDYLEIMNREEFLHVASGGKKLWAVIVLGNPPPPLPKTAGDKAKPAPLRVPSPPPNKPNPPV